MAETLSNRENKGGGGGQSLSPASARAKVFGRHLRLVESILISVSYINAISHNQAMAQPPAERPAEQPPERRTPEQTTQLADRALNALRSYVLDGTASSRSEFLRVYSANSNDDAFFNRLQQGISASPEVFRNLLVAYEAKRGGYPSPEEFVAALEACYSELRKPRAERNLAPLVSQYGQAFVSEAERISTARSVPVRIPSQVDDRTINHFLAAFSASGVPATEPAEERMRA
ncbi:MAG: hypothetical protein AB1324_04115, partial [Candidatus Micrarchaeota archaeon]